jgi:hypothetical protein
MILEHFVTLFDKLFLPQGIALHISMQRHITNYTLWILCVDDEVYGVLQKMALPNLRLLKLSQLETERLLRVKTERTKAEYCWTLTPFAPRFVFEADVTVDRVTYIDADLWFITSPTAIFNELTSSQKPVLITDHGYAAENDQSAKSGQFCVQFMVFERQGGESVRSWWEERCIEWCYAKFEEGKFGDQKYLDLWPEIFTDKVHILQNKELTLAPWNVNRFYYKNAIFYHFHGLRIMSKVKVSYGGYKLPLEVLDNIYKPYLRDLKNAISIMQTYGIEVRIQTTQMHWIKAVVKKILFLMGLRSFNQSAKLK